MSDANGSSDKPETPAEAELLGPEKAESRPRARKEPPVIEGEAEVLGTSTGSGGSGGAGEAPPSTATTPEGAVPVARPVLGIAVAVIAILALAGGAYYVLGRDAGPSPEEEAIAALDGRLSALEKKSEASATLIQSTAQGLEQRLGDAEQKIAAEEASPDSITAINARLDKIAAEADALKTSLDEARADAQASAGKIDALQRAMPPAGIADQVARLDAMLKGLNAALDGLGPKVDQMAARVAALEAKKEDPDAAARAALGLALANLARAAETPSPFKSELDAVAAFLPNEPGLAALAGPAQSGVATEASLKERFPSVVQSVFDAERRAEGDGFWARFISHARALVTIRRTGEISGDDTEAVVARMEERLKVDDLAGAAGEGLKLKGPAAEAAKPWLDDAKARVATDETLRALTASVAGRLAKAKG